MQSKRTCPECHLIFEAELPETGVIVCPLCNAAFATLTPVIPAPSPVSLPPTTSGRQVLRGVVAIGAVLFLAAGLAYAYHLMGGIGHEAKPVLPPATSEPSTAPLPQFFEFVPIIPVEPKPQQTIVKLKPFSRAPAPRSMPMPEEESQPLTLPERINRAIDRGVACLRARHTEVNQYRNYLGLLGLTLLECGVAADDLSVRQIAAWIRAREREITQTYELTLAILFLDRLGELQDRTLIRSFGQRLLSGQFECGAWTYSYLMNARRNPSARTPSGLPAIPPMPNWPNVAPIRGRAGLQRSIYLGDNSNTQFAILGLWVAQRHGVPARSALLATEQYFRATQASDGSWAYNPNAKHYRDSMTCAGLMSLAMRYGVVGGQGRDMQSRETIHIHDAAINRGLSYLAQALDRITTVDGRIGGVDARDSLYFLWSLERMAVVYDLKKIGEREWYPWAAQILVESQGQDGHWGGGNPVSTCFALLILKRSNFAKDLQLAVKEPPSRPLPYVAGPTILHGQDALLGKTGKPQVPAPLSGTAIPTTPSPSLGPSITRTPSSK